MLNKYEKPEMELISIESDVVTLSSADGKGDENLAW